MALPPETPHLRMFCHTVAGNRACQKEWCPIFWAVRSLINVIRQKACYQSLRCCLVHHAHQMKHLLLNFSERRLRGEIFGSRHCAPSFALRSFPPWRICRSCLIQLAFSGFQIDQYRCTVAQRCLTGSPLSHNADMKAVSFERALAKF